MFMALKIKFLVFFLIIAIGLRGQNSPLATGDWYKFAVDKEGVFKLDANFLRNLGVDTRDINPNNIKIYGNGGRLLPEKIADFRYDSLQENAIYINGEEDGVFNNQDYILFYAQGPHTWDVDVANYTVSHVQNIYSDKSYYFLTISNEPGKRITQKPIVEETTNIITIFDDYIFYEKEETNLFAVGRLWFGEDLSTQNNQIISLPFSNHVSSSEVTVKVVGASQSTALSSMSVLANGEVIPNISFPASTTSLSIEGGLAKQGATQGTIVLNSDLVDVSVTYENNGNPAAKGFLDYIEVFGQKQLLASGEQFSFRSFEAANQSADVTYQIENKNNVFQVWDVTDPLNAELVVDDESRNVFTFSDVGGRLKEYVVLNENDFYTPEQVNDRKVENQNLHALTDIQYLVITTDELSAQGQRLADHHQNNSNLTTKVVLLSDIYNEFASGSPDLTGIRDFIKHLHDRSSEDSKLAYVCFLGDSSYDYKDRITGNNNIVPTYHAEQSFDLVFSYVTDDFFVMIDDEDGGMQGRDTIDITSGRIPVTGVNETEKVIDKILNYYSTTTFGNWRNTITLIADDIDDVDTDSELQSDLEKLADSITKNKPIFNINKIYADAFNQENTSGGERYPEVNAAIENAMEKGSLVFDYFGHGGEDSLGQERFVEATQISNYSNFNTLPLFITVTCEFSRFDNPLRNTAGEKMFVNPNGGAVSMITTTRAVFINFGDRFNVKLANYVFDFENKNESIAKGLINTKNTETNRQRFFIYFFGDPAMKLAIPKPNVVITKLNDVAITQSLDTIKALSKIKLEGLVTDDNNNVLPNFNGTIDTTIYDKSVDKQTLDNDGAGIINIFDSQESKIFTGKSSVVNGAFSMEFIVPKDIKIAFGKGKISMYAKNNEVDKGGANFDVIVGGIDEDAPDDTTPPEIQAFLNDTSFLDGAETNTSPNLILKLFDASGINTSITAVDHDIVAILDGDQSNPIILNDFYETALDDFTKGEVNYQLKDLEVGEHNLKIKVWDTYNNSSEVTLSFVVVSDLGLNLTNVLNYPNPFVNYTEFWFTHNKPNQPLEVQVQIFTVSGKLIKTINEFVQTTGSLSRTIAWNGLDDFGNKIGKGVYVYKLTVNSTTDNQTAEKYEKLVIL